MVQAQVKRPAAELIAITENELIQIPSPSGSETENTRPDAR